MAGFPFLKIAKLPEAKPPEIDRRWESNSLVLNPPVYCHEANAVARPDPVRLQKVIARFCRNYAETVASRRAVMLSEIHATGVLFIKVARCFTGRTGQLSKGVAPPSFFLAI